MHKRARVFYLIAPLFLLFVSALFSIARAGDVQRKLAAIKVQVGSAGAVTTQPKGRISFGATAAGSTYTVTWTQMSQLGDGTMSWLLTYTNAGNAVVHMRQLTLDAACTRVVDQYGTLIYTTTGPTDTLCTTQAALLSRTNTMVNNAATSGKLGL